MNLEPVVAQVGRERPVCRASFGRLRYTGNSRHPQGLCVVSKHGPVKLRCIILAIVPATPSSRMGYAGRNSETEPTPSSSSSGLHDRGSKGRSATVDCCSSEFECSRREARDNLRARHVSVLTFSCVSCTKYRLRAGNASSSPSAFRAVTAIGRSSRSSSAYVPSARKAGPHAHPL